MEYEVSRIFIGVNWCGSLNWKWVTVIYSSQGCGLYCWLSLFPPCLLISKSKCSELANVLTRPFCVFPCSCCEVILTPIPWEQTVLVIDHSCGSEKRRLKICSTGAAEEANKEITLLKTAIKIIIIVENLLNDFLIQSLVPFSFEPWLLISFPKQFREQCFSLPKQTTHFWHLGCFFLSHLSNTEPASPHPYRDVCRWHPFLCVIISPP